MHSSSLPAIALAACSCVCFQTAAASVTYPGTTPGAPAAHREGDVYTFSDNLLSASWKVDGSRLIPLGIVNKERGATDEKAATGAPGSGIVPPFHGEGRLQSPLLPVCDGRSSRHQRIERAFRRPPPGGTAGRGRYFRRFPGQKQRADGSLEGGIEGGFLLHVKETYRIEASKEVDLKKVQLIDLQDPTLAVKGTVPGSPLVSEREGTFAGIELPVARAQAAGGTGTVGFDCNLPMGSGNAQTFTTVLGVWPENQLRRGFLYYLERERAAPYRQFLHYNGWYDDGLDPTEKTLVKTAGEYRKELGSRHVRLRQLRAG